MRIASLLTAVFSTLAFVLVNQGSAQQMPKDIPVVPPLTSVPTFSTANIARQGHFYVGGKWVGKPGEEVMRGAMYVELGCRKKSVTSIRFCSYSREAGKQTSPCCKRRTGDRAGP